MKIGFRLIRTEILLRESGSGSGFLKPHSGRPLHQTYPQVTLTQWIHFKLVHYYRGCGDGDWVRVGVVILQYKVNSVMLNFYISLIYCYFKKCYRKTDKQTVVIIELLCNYKLWGHPVSGEE